MSKKRKRDGAEVDVDLVKIYDHLASEDDSVRIKAAHQLLTKIYRPDLTTEEQLKSILTRLFRGLCSGRKAARHGFAVALTELLAQLSSTNEQARKAAMTPAQIIDILESQTVADSNTSGQDERDHYLGRVFGAEAIVKSGVLFTTQGRYQWKRLLEWICDISQKKPWLRQESGWVLYEVAASDPTETKKAFVEDILRVLTSRRLIRTPEGVAIWLAAQQSYPMADLSTHAWKHKNPLSSKDVNSLGEIMKNARSEGPDTDHGAQGAAMWSANIHFAWGVVLKRLYGHVSKEEVSLEDFWLAAVDAGLFSKSSSVERKTWGMLLWAMVLESAPLEDLPLVFTKNALHCLVTALHGQDGYLRKTAEKVLETLKQRFTVHLPPGRERILGGCLKKLIVFTDFADFDNLTKSDTVVTLLDSADAAVRRATFRDLSTLLSAIDGDNAKEVHLQRRYLLDLQSKMFTACFKREMSAEADEDIPLTSSVILDWLAHLYSSRKFSADTRSFLQDRLAAAFEQALRHGRRGRVLLQNTLSSPNWRTSNEIPILEFDNQVSKTIKRSFAKLNEFIKAEKQAQKTSEVAESGAKQPPSLIEGIILLYCVVLFEVFCGEAEVVEMLRELEGDNFFLLTMGKLDSDEQTQICDSLLETLLGLASRSSKFLRNVVVQVFESLASRVSEEGISSLAKVLLTTENAQGQLEMFEAADADQGSASNDSENEDLDSDVELLDDSEEGDENSDSDPPESASESDSLSSNDESIVEGDQTADDELAAFDAALASALGTRKAQDDLAAETSESSDEDMDDEEMMALDEKLAEVFKARKQATSKKKERKDAKENIVNFKNRVVDLVEVFFKQENTNPLSLQLVLPLLQAVRTTHTKQLADRLCNVLRDFCSKCKGQNVPMLPTGGSDTVLETLKAVHAEACMESSNAHSAAASQASILLVKTLVKAGVGMDAPISVYADTRMLQLTDKTCKVSPSFFTDWNNWCTSARLQLAK